MTSMTPPHTVLSRSSNPKPFFTRFFVRDRLSQPHHTIECGDVQEVIITGVKMFQNFSARNPWIFSDSVRGMAWVFLDPESVSPKELGND
jgi:hypothetical protein